MPTLASPFCSPMTAPSNQATRKTETFHFFHWPPDQLTSSPYWPPNPSSPLVNSVIMAVLPFTMPTLSPSTAKTLSSLPVHVPHLPALTSQVPPSHLLSQCRSSTPSNLLHQHHLHYHHHCRLYCFLLCFNVFTRRLHMVQDHQHWPLNHLVRTYICLSLVKTTHPSAPMIKGPLNQQPYNLRSINPSKPCQ
jgi:hypothetical protein